MIYAFCIFFLCLNRLETYGLHSPIIFNLFYYSITALVIDRNKIKNTDFWIHTLNFKQGWQIWIEVIKISLYYLNEILETKIKLIFNLRTIEKKVFKHH